MPARDISSAYGDASHHHQPYVQNRWQQQQHPLRYSWDGRPFPGPDSPGSYRHSSLYSRGASGRYLPPPHGDLDTPGMWPDVEALWNSAWFGPNCQETAGSWSRKPPPLAQSYSGMRVSKSGQRTSPLPSLRNSNSGESLHNHSSTNSTPASTTTASTKQLAPPPQIPIMPYSFRRRVSFEANIPAVQAIAVSQRSNGFNKVLSPEDKTANMAMGTWSKRQVRLLSLETVDEGGTMLADAQEDDDDDQPLPSLASAGTLVSQALQLHQQQLEEAEAKAGNGGDPSHEEVRDAAWRWRFQRRWHAEQNRALDTEQSSLPKDKTEDALQYLCAGAGAGWNMQVSVLQTGNSQELEGSQNSFKFGSLLLEGDMTGSLRSQNSKLLSQSSLGEATKEVNDLNRRANELLIQQQELERQAETKWRDLTAHGSSDDWVGNRMETVELDDWGGPFCFVLVKVHGRGGKQQILVKGHNNCSEDGLVADVNKTINQVAFKYKLPVESMQLMGGGLMEWSKDGGNCLSLHSGYVRSQDCRHHTTQPSEILNLAGALAKKHLPITYKMMVNGRPQ